MADSDRVSLRYVEESSWANYPTSPTPTLQDIRFRTESLKQESSTAESDEIRNDRQLADVVRTSIRGVGDIGIELSYGAFDDFLQALLMASAWSSVVQVTDQTDIQVDGVANSFIGSDGEFSAFSPNQWVKSSGFTNSANNGIFKIVSIGDSGTGNSDNEMVVSGGTLITEAAGQTVTIVQGGQILNGTTETSFAIEKQFNDLSNKFALYTGMIPNQLSLDVSAEAIITGAFSFMGEKEESKAATIGDGSPTAAPTNEVMSAVEDVLKVLENQTAYSGVLSVGLTINNNLRNRMAVGNLGPIGIGKGRLAVSGTFQAYFESEALLDKYLNFTSTSLALIFQDGDGNAYVIDMPEVKLSDGGRVAGGPNSDVIEDIGFSSFRDSTEDTTIRIARFAA